MGEPEKSPRITAGPIEDLGLKVDKLIRMGFVIMGMKDEKPLSDKSDTPSFVLTIYSLFGEEKAKLEPPLEKDYSFLSIYNHYLSENRMYVARAILEDVLGDLTGDLYMERKIS